MRRCGGGGGHRGKGGRGWVRASRLDSIDAEHAVTRKAEVAIPLWVVLLVVLAHAGREYSHHNRFVIPVEEG